jgi:hypothetical protein
MIYDDGTKWIRRNIIFLGKITQFRLNLYTQNAYHFHFLSFFSYPMSSFSVYSIYDNMVFVWKLLEIWVNFVVNQLWWIFFTQFSIKPNRKFHRQNRVGILILDTQYIVYTFDFSFDFPWPSSFLYSQFFSKVLKKSFWLSFYNKICLHKLKVFMCNHWFHSWWLCALLF